ncbi:thiamine pyrophosphate-binding protein [Undibacter mobilis]|uniref:Thiamine pyrophosphate-binding protein n=1 Tax=Undibacter mobilis TaxID=2292256 RepID=A0A371BAQ0_9BRAD|nr:thiamine pyrophosphate-dependent enzyme [Undibacter mobilis]RDV04658.1 thiamine pyrophosphate-binding protein [Undibacter mobilis]
MKADVLKVEAQPVLGWGSDVIAELLRRLGIEYVCVNPGSSFRGLHDSLVNYLGNEKPQMLLALHEQSVVAIAHGYYKACGKPMAVVLHSNVGLMAGMMSIFNAWCDRVPILIFGATGAVDSAVRRSWIDWNHTFRDQGAMVRNFVKWDDQPASPAAAVEGVLRAYKAALTAPRGPSYVILDRRLQEDKLEADVRIPDIERFRPPLPAEAPLRIVERVHAMLTRAQRPVFLFGRVSPEKRDWDKRIKLAEHLNARVVTDLRMGASFPTDHPLHGGPADLFLSPQDRDLLAKADIVLSLDWYDLADTMAQAGGSAKVIHASIDSHIHNGYNGDHQRLPAIDVEVPTQPDVLVAALLDRFGEVSGRNAGSAAKSPAKVTLGEAVPTLADIGHVMSRLREGRAITLARVPLNWPAASYDFHEPLDYLGYDGGGGVGSGPGMAVGAALALAGSGRIVVGIMGDGEFLGASSALWTAAHYDIPVLIIVANNRSYFTDEIQQETVAKERQRPAENKWIGQRIDDPAVDIVSLAKGVGVEAEGPVHRACDLEKAIARGLEMVSAGKPYVIDVTLDSTRGASFDWLEGHA